MRSIIIGIAIVAAATPALATDFSSRWDESTPTYTTIGVGSLTCQTFAEHSRDAPRAFDNALIDWAQGYMSGRNEPLIFEKKLNAGAGELRTTLSAALHSYCDRNPKPYVQQTSPF